MFISLPSQSCIWSPHRSILTASCQCALRMSGLGLMEDMPHFITSNSGHAEVMQVHLNADCKLIKESKHAVAASAGDGKAL